MRKVIADRPERDIEVRFILSEAVFLKGTRVLKSNRGSSLSVECFHQELFKLFSIRCGTLKLWNDVDEELLPCWPCKVLSFMGISENLLIAFAHAEVISIDESIAEAILSTSFFNAFRRELYECLDLLA